jgi:hypothetical protein
MQNPTTTHTDQAESSVAIIPTESGMAIDDIDIEAMVPTKTKRAPATGQENQYHLGKSHPMMTVNRRHDTRRNDANDARKPAPVNKTDSTHQGDTSRSPNDGDNSKRSTSMHPASEPVPKRAKKQDRPGWSCTSQNAANGGDRKPTAIDTPPKPQCDEVYAVEPRLIPTFTGLDAACDAGNTEAQFVGSHIRQTCSVHNFVSVNDGVTTQIWLDSNKEYCPSCHCFVCEIEASECPHWPVHCCADMNGPWGDIWRTQREAARAARSADELITDAGNRISGARYADDVDDYGDPEDEALAVGDQGPEAVPAVAGNHSNESREGDALLDQLGPLIAGEIIIPCEPSVKSKKQQWDDNYDSVLAFVKEHKHLRLPHKHAETRRLSRWLSTQKKRKYISDDERDKLILLKEYGYEYDDNNRAAKFENDWTTSFNDLVEYKRVHGVSVVPKTDNAHQKLYNWIKLQRRTYKRGSLLGERREKLVKFGFEFQRIQPYNKKTRYSQKQEKTWDEMYNKLCDFKQHHGHCIATYNDESNEALAKWVSTQRVTFGRGEMDENRRQRLDALNFTWKVQGNSSHATAAATITIDATGKV